MSACAMWYSDFRARLKALQRVMDDKAERELVNVVLAAFLENTSSSAIKRAEIVSFCVALVEEAENDVERERRSRVAALVCTATACDVPAQIGRRWARPLLEAGR